MKIQVQTTELGRALYRVQGIADKKSTMPILAHVLLTAQDNKLTVSATDMDVGLAGTYQAEVKTAGAVAVHAKQLYEIVKSLREGVVELEKLENHWVELRSGSSRFKLVGMAADEFPALPAPTQTKSFQIPAADLLRLIDRTIFCVSTDDNRHNLSGIYCESPRPKVLRMVSTDGHRLAWAEQSLAVEIPLSHGVIVPRKGFQELRRVLADGAEGATEVELGFSQSNGVLKAGSVVLSTRLVEGQFPDYEQVIPKSASKIAKINKNAFADALKRVSLLSQGRAYGVRMIFDQGRLELVAEDPELGEAHETLDIEYKSDKLTIGFNARYVLDVLAMVTEEGIAFELSDDLSPGILQPLEDRGFKAVVMPMRI